MSNVVEWRTVKEFPVYDVSSQGDVRHSITGRVKSKRQLKSGNVTYERVTLYTGNIQKTFTVHILMAQEFLGRTEGLFVDHIDGNGLNNMLSNLRMTTNRGNQQNTYRHRGGKGVGYWRSGNRFISAIRHNGKLYQIGSFNEECKAQSAYNWCCTYMGCFLLMKSVHKRNLVKHISGLDEYTLEVTE